MAHVEPAGEVVSEVIPDVSASVAPEIPTTAEPEPTEAESDSLTKEHVQEENVDVTEESNGKSSAQETPPFNRKPTVDRSSMKQGSVAGRDYRCLFAYQC